MFVCCVLCVVARGESGLAGGVGRGGGGGGICARKVTNHPYLRDHDAILVCVVWHTCMPTSEVSKHDVALVHTRKDRRTHSSSSLNSVFHHVARRLSNLLLSDSCLRGCNDLISLIGKRMAAEPELCCTILLGEVDQSSVGDYNEGTLGMFEAGVFVDRLPQSAGTSQRVVAS